MAEKAKQILTDAAATRGVLSPQDRERLGMGLGEKFKRVGQTAAGRARTW